MLRRMLNKENGESGFTLIEAVVALALVTIVLAAVGSLVATNVRGTRNLEQHLVLIETARAIASNLPRGGDPLPDTLAGELLRHRWQMRITPFAGSVPLVPEARFMPQLVELRVRSPSGAVLSLETIRLREGGVR